MEMSGRLAARGTDGPAASDDGTGREIVPVEVEEAAEPSLSEAETADRRG